MTEDTHDRRLARGVHVGGVDAGAARAPDAGTKRLSGLYRFLAWCAPHEEYPKDRPLYLRLHTVVLAVWLLVSLAEWPLSKKPFLIERYYSEGIGQAVGRVLTAVSGLVPFSVLEAVCGLLVCWGAWAFFRMAWHILRRRRRWPNALACGLLACLSVFCVFGVLGAVFGGFNVLRPELAVRLGWQESNTTESAGRIQTEELVPLCEELIEATNTAYTQAHEAETPEPDLATFIADLDASIEDAYVRVRALLDLSPSFALRRSAAKAASSSWLLSCVGIDGYFHALTGEALYNETLPRTVLPVAIAHEKAHQRGLMREDEAEFAGYLACALSDDPRVRYSGYMKEAIYLLLELQKGDHERARGLYKRLLPGVRQDEDDINTFYARYDSNANRLMDAAHDLQLKLMGVEEGTMVYTSPRLLILFARHNGGSCVPAGQRKPVRIP